MKQSPSPARHSSAPTPFIRPMVLGTAFLVGLAIAFAPRSPTAHAQEPKAATATAPKSATKSVTFSDGSRVEIKIEAGDKTPPGTATSPASEGQPDAGTPPDNVTKDAPDRRGAKPRKHARVTIDGIGTDHEFDSIGDLAHDQPAIAAMVVLIVAVVFFAPVLAIALILWYRMRKARMLNETMLALAEKGIVPPAEALDALSGGKPPAASAPLHQQAQEIRRRAAWSDLRKGVMVGGVGLALSLYSLLEDREANALGLVLLCVGIGFVVLWWFEERHLFPSGRAAPDAPPGSGNTAGNPPSV